MGSEGTNLADGRPQVFSSLRAEICFSFSIVLSQIMSEYFISGFFVTLPTIVRGLQIPESSSTWPASAFTLTTGASLLIFGRLADMYGSQRVYLIGLAWYTICSLVCGFAVNNVMLCVVRALQGFGPAAFLTSGLGLLGATYPPGRRKNIVFAIYGGSAPVGFFSGIIMGGVTSQKLSWRWYFWIGAIVAALALAAGFWSISWNFKPTSDEVNRDKRDERGPKLSMDYIGATLFFTGLILFIFGLTGSAHAPQGWATPYIAVLFSIGGLLLIVCVFLEAKYIASPLLPLEVLLRPRMGWFMMATFLMFGTFGVWLFYVTLFLQNIQDVMPLDVVAQFVPFGLGGLIISILGGYFLHIIPGFVLLILSSVAWVLAPLLVALANTSASYWTWIFPAMICGTLGIDISYLVASVFLTSAVKESEQGSAGAIFNTLQFLGISFWLGVAQIISAHYHRTGLLVGYQDALWSATSCAGVALIILVAFVRIGKATSVDAEQTPTDAEKAGPQLRSA